MYQLKFIEIVTKDDTSNDTKVFKIDMNDDIHHIMLHLHACGIMSDTKTTFTDYWSNTFALYGFRIILVENNYDGQDIVQIMINNETFNGEVNLIYDNNKLDLKSFINLCKLTVKKGRAYSKNIQEYILYGFNNMPYAMLELEDKRDNGGYDLTTLSFCIRERQYI